MEEIDQDKPEGAREYIPRPGETISKVFIMPPDSGIDYRMFAIICLVMESQIIAMGVILAYFIIYRIT
jgi:hypothetical protein